MKQNISVLKLLHLVQSSFYRLDCGTHSTPNREFYTYSVSSPARENMSHHVDLSWDFKILRIYKGGDEQMKCAKWNLYLGKLFSNYMS